MSIETKQASAKKLVGVASEVLESIKEKGLTYGEALAIISILEETLQQNRNSIVITETKPLTSIKAHLLDSILDA